ncbi:hypothetical protein ACFLYB_04610 [Chloroflexota bacterium]
MNNTKVISAVTVVIGILLIVIGIIMLNVLDIVVAVLGTNILITSALLTLLWLFILDMSYITDHLNSRG